MAKKINVPWKQVFKLNKDVNGVECWNLSKRDGVFNLPAGQLVRLDNVNDKTSITVCCVDETGKSVGITLGGFWANGHAKRGYRFIIPNGVLSEAIGIPLPKSQRDLVGEIIAYESGKASPKQADALFTTLRKTGLGRQLQGHYSSRM
jgi:hypothetical protein